MVSLALGWIGYIARLVRSSLLEVLGEPYIRTSRAYGISNAKIVYKYALKNAAIPTVAVLGLGIGRLLGGAIFAEIIFARPGIGTLIYSAINARNYPGRAGRRAGRRVPLRAHQPYRRPVLFLARSAHRSAHRRATRRRSR